MESTCESVISGVRIHAFRKPLITHRPPPPFFWRGGSGGEWAGAKIKKNIKRYLIPLEKKKKKEFVVSHSRNRNQREAKEGKKSESGKENFVSTRFTMCSGQLFVVDKQENLQQHTQSQP